MINVHAISKANQYDGTQDKAQEIAAELHQTEYEADGRALTIAALGLTVPTGSWVVWDVDGREVIGFQGVFTEAQYANKYAAE